MISNTLYAHYIKERQDLSVIESEHGFITYKIMTSEDFKSCFIQDMFVRKEYRRTKHGTQILNQLVEIASKENCLNITANIWLWDPNANNTLKAALASGFRVFRTNDGVLSVERLVKGK